MTLTLQTAGVEVSERATDAAALRDMLGHAPRGWWRVVARGLEGDVKVVATYPLWWDTKRKVRPFPNLFWLSDADLIARISELERVGTIGVLEKELAGDAALRGQVDADHRRYAALRWAMLDNAARAIAAADGFDEALQHRGVGGLTPGSLKIKCLHAHVAHHLAMREPNAVGERVMDLLG